MTTENGTPAAIRQALREYEDCGAAARNKLRSTIQVPLYRADPETSQAIDEAFQDCVRKIERGPDGSAHAARRGGAYGRAGGADVMNDAPLLAPWTPPVGHADIAPSRFERIEGDGYFTLDSEWIVPALLGAVPIKGRVLEPAAGRGHISLELKRAGLIVESFDIRAYENPLVPDIGLRDIRELESLAGFSWVVTNLPYGDLEELAEILVKLGTRDRCNVALLVRAEWPTAKARHNLIHRHPWFHGVVMLTSRPRWVPREQETASPRHNFAWAIWGAQPRVGDVWIRWAGKAPPSLWDAR